MYETGQFMYKLYKVKARFSVYSATIKRFFFVWKVQKSMNFAKSIQLKAVSISLN